MFLRHILLYLATASLCLSWPALANTTQTTDKDVMQVTLWGGKSGRTAYEHALLQQILIKTADRYPPYDLWVNNEHLGAERGRQVVANGQHANIYVSGLREDAYTDSGEIVVVPTPTMKGLMGYRSAIIRADDQERFALAVQQSELRELVVGQGNRWADAKVLRHNKFSVDDSGRYENLLSMLSYGRFDTVFFGVVEAPAELAASNMRDALSIAPQNVIYYPHAMVFQVSGQHPLLAKRVADGLAIVRRDGTLDRLLDEYFSDAIAHIKDPNTQIIVLEHPQPSIIPELTQPLLAQGR
ncbi:hypothetical protein QWI17_13190 [Gilvimarinus sp. SDUM040013]|uniref:Solute-binding protein family 3/N-terminal domain-containing protein n=1 Tax=Gilvimarinus gilvus TaxID=3058038 RepID=A0ABU4RTQ8_9GAMM|nr:hypothetical protein [Gilvimarinus sp. SDUM040013]MDO3386795.1 hypothetical protein [Gilvimarinus sp. SDUM040013]MDX6848275.1 hypothetical protein [Gilvimarinus sp. SDUM040013]